MKLLAVFLLLVLALPLVPVSAIDLKVYPPGGNPISQATVGLNSTTGTKVTNFNPATIPGYFGKDIGPVSWVTSLTSFQWNMTNNDYLQFKPPTVGATALSNSLVYYNSTETVWQMTTGGNSVNVFFKPSAYSAKLSIQAVLTLPQNVCIPFTAPSIIVQQAIINKTTGQNIGLAPSIKAGNEVFSWGDILQVYSPTWNVNKLCISLPAGTTNIDPIALDGSAGANCNNVSSCAVSLTTTSTNDIIVVFCDCYPKAHSFTIADGSALTWHTRAHVTDTQENGTEWYAKSAGTQTADSITISSSAGSYFAVIAFGVSGADQSTIFDTHAGIPATDASDNTCPLQGGNPIPCIKNFSTSNANDFIYLMAGDSGGSTTQTAGAGFTLIKSQGGTGGVDGWAEYEVVSATQSGITMQFVTGIPGAWLSIGDAIMQAAASTVTQPIKITMANSAPTSTITISGCAVSNGTFSADGFTHTYSSVTASCSITLTAQNIFSNTRWGFNISPHPTYSQSVSFSTCSSGTCSTYQNTTYRQVTNFYHAVAQTPTTWDGNYTVKPYATFLGTASQTSWCSVLSPGHTVEGQTDDRICSGYSDYNQLVTVKGFSGGNTIGNTWNPIPSGNNTVTPITGGNTYHMEYVQSTGGVYDSSSYNWLLALPFLLIAFIAGKKL